MRLMCIPGALPAGTAAHIACFHSSCTAAEAADADFNDLSAPPPAGTAPAPEPLPHCTLVLHSVQHCEAAQAAALHLMAHCAQLAPVVASEAETQSALSLAMELIRFGGTEHVQPAAVAAAAALAAGLPMPKLPAVLLLQSVLAAVDEAADLERLISGAAEAGGWQNAVLQLLQLCIDALAACGRLAATAPGLADTLCRACVAAPPESRLQAELVHLLADVVTVLPPLVDRCGGCLALLPTCGVVAAALVRLLRAAQLRDACEDAAQQAGGAEAVLQVKLHLSWLTCALCLASTSWHVQHLC